MMTELLPLAGSVTAGSAMHSANQYSQAPDGSFDPLGYGGALMGAGLGGLTGLLGGQLAHSRAAKKLGEASQGFLPSLQEPQIFDAVTGEPISVMKKGAAAEAKGLRGLLKGGKGGISRWLSANPNLARGGGAALGAMLGAKMLANSFTANRHQQTAQEMQALAQQDAERQQRNLMALTRGSNIRF